MSSLYEIDKKLNDAINFGCDTETGEFFDDNALNELHLELDKKIEGIGIYSKNIQSDINELDTEIKNLKERKEQKEKKKNNIENYLKDYLLNNDIPMFETPKVLIKFRKSTTVNVLDINKVPLDFIKRKEIIEDSVDKNAVKAYIKSHKDETINGIEVVENKNMSIK